METQQAKTPTWCSGLIAPENRGHVVACPIGLDPYLLTISGVQLRRTINYNNKQNRALILYFWYQRAERAISHFYKADMINLTLWNSIFTNTKTI